jgi:two-component system, OmpR family, sensor kinase
MSAAESSGKRSPRRTSLTRRISGSLRSRLLLSYIVLLAIASFASVLAVRQVLLVRLDDRVAEDLQQEVEEFEALAAEGVDPESGRPFGNDVKTLFDTYLERNVPDDDEELITVPRKGTPQRLGGDNTTSFSFADFIPDWRTLNRVERGEVESPAGDVRYVAVPVEGESQTLGTFVVAIFVADEREQVDEAVQIVAAVAAAVLILGSLAAFSIVGRVLSPLSELRDAAQSVSGTEMSRRIDVDGDDEVAELAHTFNGMLDRIEIAFASQREFIRDVSHELRTPIAVSRGHLELLAGGHLTGEAERQATIALVTGELDRMNRFVFDLLLLAKAESPNFLQLETVALGQFTAELVAKVEATADREWIDGGRAAVSIVADRQRLTQAVMNLVGNAVEHTENGDEIEVGAGVSGSEVTIWVRDSGVGIAPSEQRQIFTRFTRGGGSSRLYEGTGIGLAIVRAIAEAHGGRVRVTSRPGEGARFDLILPVEQEIPEEHDDLSIEVGSP